MANDLALFKVTTKLNSIETDSVDYRTLYVVATDMAKARNAVAGYLSKREIGYLQQRVVISVELIANATEYPESRHLLLIDKE